MVTHTLTWTDDEFARARAYFDALEAARSPPAPAGTPPKVLFQMQDWRVDFPRTWTETSSPETATGSNVSNFASVVPTAKDALTFTLKNVKGAPDGKAGARAHYDPTLTRSWAAFKPYLDKTLEFSDVWSFPAELPNYYGDNGFLTAGWQFKNSAAEGAPAGMAMNLHTFKGVGMRWWLQGNSFATRAQDDTFPTIPVGADVATRLLVHFHYDPTKGWMEFQYGGKTLKVVGANMAADGGCGVYKALYGTCDGVMIARQTVITALD